VGKRRLEKSLRIFEEKNPNKCNFKINWIPFFLDSSLPKIGENKMQRYIKKFGESRVQSMIPRMIETGMKDGIKFSYGGNISNTIDSHRLATWALEKFGSEKQNELIEELFKNYFEEEKCIGDHPVLLAAANKVGLEGASEILQTNAYEKEVHNLINRYQYDRGIQGVPHFIFNDQIEISGAQNFEVFLNILEKIASKSS